MTLSCIGRSPSKPADGYPLSSTYFLDFTQQLAPTPFMMRGESMSYSRNMLAYNKRLMRDKWLSFLAEVTGFLIALLLHVCSCIRRSINLEMEEPYWLGIVQATRYSQSVCEALYRGGALWQAERWKVVVIFLPRGVLLDVFHESILEEVFVLILDRPRQRDPLPSFLSLKGWSYVVVDAER